MLAQFGQGDNLFNIIWFIMFIIFLIFGQRLMTTQAILKLERDALDLEATAEKSRGHVLKGLSKKPTSKIKERIKSFMDFFAIPPIDIDPYGVVKKLDHVIKNSDNRFKLFVNEIDPGLTYEKQSNIKNALAGAMTTYQIAKIVRHYVETIKKYKMFQMAILLQMQLPPIIKIAKAAEKATRAFVDGMPIGDGAGPFVIAHLMKGKPKIYEDEEFALSKSKINGRMVFLSKARGPGASTGYPGKFLIKFFKKQKIDKIITIDAGLRLEGEKTGSIAEGVGIAIGGPGVDRFEIEELATRMNIPVDAIAIKVSEEEALMPMHMNIVNSVSKAIEAIEDAIGRSKKSQKILIMGIGNTCGIGNDSKSIVEVQKRIREHNKKMEEKPKKGIFSKRETL